MNIWLARDGALRLVARLREGEVETEVSGWNPAASTCHRTNVAASAVLSTM